MARPKIKVIAERTIRVRRGRAKLREAIGDLLATRGARAEILIERLAADKSVVWRPAELDGIADELRHLAFQIRRLKNAKLATEEA